MKSKMDISDFFCFYRSINSKKLNAIWEITSLCNLKCRHCFRHISGTDLSLEDKLKIVSRFDNDQIGRVLITGGEPLLSDGIIKIIREIQAKEILVKVLSNLSFDKNVILQLLRLAGTNFEISTSIDGHTDELHDYVRGYGNFSILCKNISLLTNNRVNVSVICVITKQNIAYVEDIIILCINNGIKTITFSKLIEDKSSRQCIDFYSTNKLDKINEMTFLSNIKVLRERYVGLNIRTVGFLNGECAVAGKSIMFISHQGNVHPCSMMRSENILFNILECSLNEILKNIENEPKGSFSYSCPSLKIRNKENDDKSKGDFTVKKIRKAVGAVIMNGEGNVLLAHKVKVMDGKTAKSISEWDFIKGGMKEKENIIDALKRELIEEANINEYISAVELPSFEFDFSDEIRNILQYDSQITYFFKVLVDSSSSEIKPDFDEIDELRFVSISEAFELISHDTSRTYLKDLVERGLLI